MSKEPTGGAKPQRKKRSGSEKRQRDCMVKFRAKPEERAEMKANAAAAGLSLGSFLRTYAVSVPRTRTVRSNLAPAVAELAHLKGQIGRIGGNLHQLLRLANRGDFVDPDELAEAVKDAREFLAAATEILKGV
jgi:hypothetical protein